MIKCKDCKHFKEEKLDGQTYYECLKIWNVTIYDKEFEHLCNLHETKVNGDSTSHEKALNIADVMHRFPDNPEIWKWWKEQNFQKEQGEQEYTMIFEIDLPKILKAFTEHLLNGA